MYQWKKTQVSRINGGIPKSIKRQSSRPKFFLFSAFFSARFFSSHSSRVNIISLQSRKVENKKMNLYSENFLSFSPSFQPFFSPSGWAQIPTRVGSVLILLRIELLTSCPLVYWQPLLRCSFLKSEMESYCEIDFEA